MSVGVGVGVGVGDVEGLSDVTIVAIGTTLCVGDGLGVGVVAAALPHPTANIATSASAAIFKVVTVSELIVTLFGQARAKGHCVTARNPLSIRRAKGPIYAISCPGAMPVRSTPLTRFGMSCRKRT